ncbi:MAG: hypothetical protein ACTSSB_14825 [Candidatus Heimdallarchaeota archaeon]
MVGNIIPKTRKKNKIDKAFFTKNKDVLAKLFDIVLWPIVSPIVFDISAENYEKLREEIWQLFFSTISNFGKDIPPIDLTEVLSPEEQPRITEFITGLVTDFTSAFHEEMMSADDPETVITSIKQMVDQQTVIMWLTQIVEQTIAPLLIFSVKAMGKVDEAKRILIRILVATAIEQISSDEAAKQAETILKINYDLSDEIILFVKSTIKSIANFKEKHGIEELAKIGERSIASSSMTQRISQSENLRKSIEDPIFEREKLVNEWMKNILLPSTIGLKIAGEESYEKFIKKVQANFELFLDQKLSAEDFTERLDKELKEFGGDDEELISPIRESIAASTRFLEIARVDDPSLSLLLLIVEEERESTKRTCL